MIGTKMTEYDFEVRKRITVTVHGKNTDENYEKAMEEAVRQIKEDIDEDWLELRDAEEHTDYEEEYKEKEYA